ncbi:unnamed protein product [Parnassius apollo]|uniref:(apollo) hypothetical protein n=1 Tax=Parnassius apollo TaxID=110799 RepID=A0A8S3W6S2_PARAO|nr:unnamed protein product [Parnassius apollo]
MRGLPGPVRARLRTLATTTKIHFANWNIGTLTGRSTELAAILARRKVAVAFLQETRWKANRNRNIGHGYKLIYTGCSGGENGVAVVLAEHFHDSVLEVRRICDRLMVVSLLIEGVVTHLIRSYAPQIGCSDADKTLFWDRLGDVLCGIPLSHDVVLSGDLNAHVGEVQGEYERRLWLRPKKHRGENHSQNLHCS